MSDLAHTDRIAGLETWRSVQAQGRAIASLRLSALIARWTSVLVIVTLLYLMIGHTPYNHELTFDPLTQGAVMSPVNRFFWIGLLLLATPILILRREVLPRLVAQIWPVLLLFVWFAVSTRWALDPAASQRRLFQTLVGLVICVAARVGLPDGRQAHRAIAWSCAIVIITDLISWAVAPGLSMTDLGLAAIHTHKNTLGLVMLFSSLVLTPYAVARPTQAGRLFWGGLTLGCLLLLVASRSKTSIALVVVAGLLAPMILVLARLRTRLLHAILASLAALTLALGFFWLTWCFVQGADPLGPIKQLNFTHRTDVWSFVLDQWKLHPIRGVGFGSFWDIDPAVQPSKQTDLWFAKPDAPTNQAHNGYLDLMVTTGLPGLLGALALLFGWMLGGLAMIREALLAPTPQGRSGLPYAFLLGLFPIMFFIHNWMESSIFTADSTFGLIIVLFGVAIDMRDRPKTISLERVGRVERVHLTLARSKHPWRLRAIASVASVQAKRP